MDRTCPNNKCLLESNKKWPFHKQYSLKHVGNPSTDGLPNTFLQSGSRFGKILVNKNAALDQWSNQTARVMSTVYWLLYLANSDLDPDLDLGILLWLLIPGELRSWHRGLHMQKWKVSWLKNRVKQTNGRTRRIAVSISLIKQSVK